MRRSRRYRRRYKKRKTRKLRGGNLPLIEVPFFTKRTNNDIPKEIQDIPLVIYQSWKTRDVPPKMKECIDKLKANNPEFDHYLYSDEDCSKFIQDNFDKSVLDTFNGLKPGAYKSDLWRYCILYKLGGIYIDVKFYGMNSLRDIISKVGEIFPLDIDDSSRSCESNISIYNGFMVAKPKNIIFKICIDRIAECYTQRCYKKTNLSPTGPCLLGSVLKENSGNNDIANTLPIKMVVTSKNIISAMNGNKEILTQYPEYRDEQKKIQTSEAHYGNLWSNKNIYNN
jgi:mannosyltransferase OCH1-like enzyme